MIYTRKTISRQLLAYTTSSSSNLPEMKRYAWILGTVHTFSDKKCSDEEHASYSFGALRLARTA